MCLARFYKKTVFSVKKIVKDNFEVTVAVTKHQKLAPNIKVK